ncbi:MAG TPA: hypothetical protein VMX57_08040 [Planctomycetota bacterium]|nr:hypothetical protein [Planctomycetota bacterium]
MAKPQRKSKNSISLFPFLSVLACSIGALIIIISTQNLIAIGSSDQVIDISGAATDKQPVYVECDAEGVLIHPEGTRVPKTDLEKPDSPLGKLLGELAADKDRRYLVLLVRPSGIESFQKCLKLAQDLKIDVGKDALLSGGQVIFTRDGKPVVQKTEEPRP